MDGCDIEVGPAKGQGGRTSRRITYLGGEIHLLRIPTKCESLSVGVGRPSLKTSLLLPSQVYMEISADRQEGKRASVASSTACVGPWMRLPQQ